ncbi:MAG: DUF3806 domain-containing protein [Halioglobus sp.]
MTARLTPSLVLFVAGALFYSAYSLAQAEPEITELTYLDRGFMQQQRELINDIAATNLGRQFSGEKVRDLDLLQALLDRGLVKPDQTRELQAMGLILGDLLAEELGLDWVIYEDPVGRSRALRYADTDNYLFPMTMIARRLEADSYTPVVAIYDKAYQSIYKIQPQRPFQEPVTLLNDSSTQ